MRQAADSGIFNAQQPGLPTLKIRELEDVLREGDVIFTRIPGTPFRQLADVTRTWTNHVGVVVGFNRFGAVVAESRIPVSCRTSFARIPWGRTTITPASLYASPLLGVVFDGKLRSGGGGRGARLLAKLAQTERYRQPHNQHVTQYALH